MKALAASAAVAAGVLLVVVPRYVLPACEYAGYPRMHCSDTARAEMILGAALIAAGALVFAARRRWPIVASAAASCVVLGLAWYMPDLYGYCASPRMPCHYGMVPGVRFVAALAGAVVVAATLLFARSTRTKTEAS
jgi:fructose-specific phosphotransferase system IIC component